MSWDCLSAEIAVMFGELTDRADERQMSLEWWVRERRQAARARDQKRSRTPHRVSYLRAMRAAKPDRQRKYDRDYYERNKEKRRAYFRQKRAQRRAA